MTPEQFQGHVVDKLGAMHEQLAEVAAASSPANLQAAVASGIREAATDPELWASIMTAVRTQAQQEAGGWLLGGIKAVFNRLALLVVVGMGVYLLGGWSALVAIFKSPPVGQ